MKHITQFQKMRMKRPTLVKVANARDLLRTIDRIERDMTSHWSVEIKELQALAQEELAREKFMQGEQQRQGRLRRWLEHVALAVYQRARA